MNIEAIKATIRTRHKLKDNADVRLLASSLVVKSIEENDPYAFTARMTTDSIDRQLEVVVPQGGDLSEFLRSGIVSWNHDYDCPVGFPNKNAKVMRGDTFIEAGMKFMRRPDNYVGEFFPDFARAFVTQAKEAGVNAGVSIGFIPIESRQPSKADRERFGADVQCVHSKWKLLELAIAPVQANQDAVVTAVGKGLIRRDVAKAVGITVPEVITITAPVAKREPVIEHVVCVVKSRRDAGRDLAATVNKQIRHTLLKEWGKVYCD